MCIACGWRGPGSKARQGCHIAEEVRVADTHQDAPASAGVILGGEMAGQRREGYNFGKPVSPSRQNALSGSFRLEFAFSMPLFGLKLARLALAFFSGKSLSQTV